MDTTQSRIMERVRALVGVREHKLIVDPQYGNTGTVSAVSDTEITSPRRLSYQFNDSYATFKLEGKADPPAALRRGGGGYIDYARDADKVDRMLDNIADWLVGR